MNNALSMVCIMYNLSCSAQLVVRIDRYIRKCVKFTSLEDEYVNI